MQLEEYLLSIDKEKDKEIACRKLSVIRQLKVAIDRDIKQITRRLIKDQEVDLLKKHGYMIVRNVNYRYVAVKAEERAAIVDKLIRNKLFIALQAAVYSKRAAYYADNDIKNDKTLALINYVEEKIKSYDFLYTLHNFNILMKGRKDPELQKEKRELYNNLVLKGDDFEKKAMLREYYHKAQDYLKDKQKGPYGMYKNPYISFRTSQEYKLPVINLQNQHLEDDMNKFVEYLSSISPRLVKPRPMSARIYKQILNADEGLAYEMVKVHYEERIVSIEQYEKYGTI